MTDSDAEAPELAAALRRLLEHPGERFGEADGTGELALAFNQVARRFDELRDAREREAAWERSVEEVKDTLLAVAFGTFDKRVERTNDGQARDVLAFLVNSTADEVQELVGVLERERDRLRIAQEQLVQSEKFAALGRLSAGVAHELSQPLTVISSLLGSLRKTPDGPVEQRQRFLELMDRATAHMAQIVDSVRTFGRPSPFELKETPAAVPLERAEQLVASDLRALGVTVSRDVPEDLPALRANADRLQQVFVNLLCNARDALATRGNGGTVWLRARANGAEVVYEVLDDGPGVAEDARARLFEPFFTTKAPKGTGLGLSVSLGIVRDHGGRLEHHPRAPGGSRFVVSVPLFKSAP